MRPSYRRLTAVAALPLLALTVTGTVVADSRVDSPAGPSALADTGPVDEPLTTAFRHLDRDTEWQLAEQVALDFPTYHPQGFALVDDLIFLSTVEILKEPVVYPEPHNGYDRSPGKGVGHVLVLDRDGTLLRDIELGRGHMYHPGGIDFDGQRVWVPVAQYRPDSKAVVYTIDPDSYRVRERFQYADHVGGIVRNDVTGRLHGVSWGSRDLFTWEVDGALRDVTANRSHFVDYQDCAHVDQGKQLCSGITELPTAGGGVYELGGLALLRLHDDEIRHELPFPYFSSTGHVVTRNPVALELDGDTVRLLAAPDDGDEPGGTVLLVYQTVTASARG